MTAPLTPADCDLRGMPYMPLDTARLLDSDTFALTTGDEFKAVMALWCKSWYQVPAASLPNDERILAGFSGAGLRWKKVRAAVMKGFVLCDDGRLYHPVVAEKALEAWTFRKAQRQKAGARWGPPPHAAAHPAALPAAVPRDIPQQSRGSPAAHPAAYASEVKLREGLLTTGVGLGTVDTAVDNPGNDTPVGEKDQQHNNFEAIDRRAAACGISGAPGEGYVALKARCAVVERQLERRAIDLGIKPSMAEDYRSLRARIEEAEVRGATKCAG